MRRRRHWRDIGCTAFEATEDAGTLEKAQRWNGAVNPLYYPAFYAAKALLATREIDAVRQRVSSVPLPHLASAGPSGVGPDRVGPHLELLRTAPRRVN